MAETVHDCSLSVELKFLEAEYERSKLRVHQDTLICQNSMLELDILCKNEELRNKARSNAELVQRGTELQLHVRSLEEEARAAKDLLKCAEQALENERNQSETKEKEFRRKCEADLKRKLDKEVRELDGVRPDLLREVQQWKEKFSRTRTQVEQLKRELRQKNRKLKDKATQIEVSESEARLIQKRADRAQVCDAAAEQLGESSSLSSKQLEEPSSPCDTEEQRGKALPESIKDEEDDKTRKTRYKKRKVRGKKMKASQTEEHAEGVKEVQHSGYEAPSDTNVRQEKERVTQEQKAEEEKINLLKGTSQGAEVQTQEREQVLGDMDNEGEESEEGKKEDTADVSETSERGDVITGKNLSESEKITGSIAEGVKALKRTGKKPQECESKKNRKNRRKAKKDNKPGKCSTETKTLGEREPEERTPCNSSEASEIIVEEAEHLEETKEQGAKEQNCDEAEKEESVGEELGKVTGEDEQEKPDHVKETEEIEGKTTTKKVIQRQRKGKKGIFHQVSQEKAVNVKRQQRKAPRKQKSDEVEESAEKEDKENSDKSDDYSEEDKKAQSRHLRKEVREKQDEKTEEMEGISKTTKVEQVEQHLQKSAAEVDKGAGETEKLQKPKTRQRETNNKFKEDEEEKKIAGNSSRKRRAVPEEAPGDIINSNPQQCVTNSHDDIKTAGTTRRAANPSARPETGKTNNSSCGDAQTSSLTEKTGELSTTTKSGKLALQAADDSRYGSVQVSVSSDPTHAVNAESNNSGMNSTDARAEQEAYKNSGKRRRKPAPVEKRGKENASKKRKPNSSTVAAAARTSETSFSDMSSILNCTKRRKGLFNVRDNSLMVAVCAQKSFVNKTVSQGQSISGIPPRLNKFMENFIAPKLLRSKPQ